VEIYTTRLESPESRALGLGKVNLLAISSLGEMAVLERGEIQVHADFQGTLARVPLAGGVPRDVLDNVVEADWTADGKEIAVTHIAGGKWRLEFPIGKVLYETSGWISRPRISPRGDKIAFLDHPFPIDDRGSVAVVDLSGNKKTLSSGWESEQGLAWSPKGDELWFSAAISGLSHSLYAVDLSGHQRLVDRAPGGYTLRDISRDGQILLTRESSHFEVTELNGGDSRPRDLTYLDNTWPTDVSPDRKTLLFNELGEGAGPNYSIYLRKTDGSPPVRLGEGVAILLTPDGKWALSFLPSSSNQLTLIPTGVGQPKSLPHGNIERYQFLGAAFPDNKRMLIIGNEPGRSPRCFVHDIAGASPIPVTPEGVMGTVLSPDGKLVLAWAEDQQKFFSYPVEGGQPREVPGLSQEDQPVQWSADGRSIFFYRTENTGAKIYRLEISSGRRDLWKEIVPTDLAGFISVIRILMTRDGKAIIYCNRRLQSQLYLANGLK
jgi:Tol biopolymer transport system component